MKKESSYQLHPAIIRTNQQIEREASHILYAENLLVRVSSIGPSSSWDLFGWNGEDHPVPILARADQAKRFTRHVMEVVTLQNSESPRDIEFGLDESEDSFIISSDDLPKSYWFLLRNNIDQNPPLSLLTLAVEIRHPMDVRPVQGEATTKKQNTVEDDACNEHEVKREVETATGEIICNNETQTNTKFTDYQIRRLLEPLRCLHSFQAVCIKAPISEQYKAQLIASMCGPGPSDQELFDEVLAMFEDARITYDSGDLDSAVTKMKYTLDTINDYKNIAPSAPHHLLPLWDACRHMKYTMWTNLGWASLKKRDNYLEVSNAEKCTDILIREFVDEDLEYLNAPSMGHDIAMVFYLKVTVWEAFADLESHHLCPRSDKLEEVVGYLREGLRHEPQNTILREQMKRREDELQIAREFEDLTEMSDRIYERGDYEPSGRGRGGYRGRGRGRGRGR